MGWYFDLASRRYKNSLGGNRTYTLAQKRIRQAQAHARIAAIKRQRDERYARRVRAAKRRVMYLMRTKLQGNRYLINRILNS